MVGIGYGGAKMGLRLLHTADVHLDWLYEKFHPEAREKRRNEVRLRWDGLVDLAIEKEVAAVMVAGDFFHSEGAADATINYCLHQMERLEKQGIWTLIVTGNHDPLTECSIWRRRRFPDKVRVFGAGDWESFTELPGVEVVGLSFDPLRRNDRVLNRLPKAVSSGARIGLVHSQIFEGQAEPDYYPISENDVMESSLDYLALGHVHRPKTWSWGQTRMVYPGSPSRLTFKDLDSRGVELITVEDGAVISERIELEDRGFQVIELDLTSLGAEGVYKEIRDIASRELCLKVLLTGVIGDGTEFIGDGLLRDFSGEFFHLELEDKTLIIPCEADNDPTVKGIFLRDVAARFKNPSLSEDERTVLKYALHYGLSALKGVGGKR
jgi:exonuclease SbcD